MSIDAYTSHINKLHTQQSERADPAQVENSAGGFSFAVDRWTRLDRFLILGSEGGSYYARERKLTRENAACVEECLGVDPLRAVARIREISQAGRAPKNTPAIFALALATTSRDEEARKMAFAAIPSVCRTGTHLFEFVQAVRTMRGLGKGLAKAITRWYTDKSAEQLAYQLVKYQQRGGMSHRDVLRLTRRHGRQKSLEPPVEAALRWAVRGPNELGERKLIRRVGDSTRESTYNVDASALPRILAARDELVRLDTTEVRRACELVVEHRLTHEMVPSQFLARPEVWEALLPHMPPGALLRNLGRMTSIGLLTPMGVWSALVVAMLDNAEAIRKARLHPLSVLVALNVYKQGQGQRGGLSWEPVRQVIDALDAAFYHAFGSVESTGKHTLLALDVSASMGMSQIAGMTGITPRIGSAAMAMVTARTESNYDIMGFMDKFVPLSISPRQRLDDVVQEIRSLPFGATDCSLPMLYALEHKVPVDTFIVYTDSETWAGDVHPHQALRDYRNKTGIPAKLVVVGMVSNGFTIADPNDAGMLDVVGFDTATPSLINNFAR